MIYDDLLLLIEKFKLNVVLDENREIADILNQIQFSAVLKENNNNREILHQLIRFINLSFHSI